MKLISAKVAVASALLSAALSGCIVAPAPGYYADVAVTEVVNRWHLQGGRWEREERERR
jgi:hypothetical protein